MLIIAIQINLMYFEFNSTFIGVWLQKTHYGVMYAVMNEDEACLVSAIKAGAPLNSHIDLEDTSVAGIE